MAMPATRATGIATPVNGSPSNNCPTSEGTISNPNPVAASAIAVKISAYFIVPPFRCEASAMLEQLGLSLLLLREGFEFKGQLVDLAGELERDFVAILDERKRSAGIQADVEGFVLRECDRGGVFHRIFGHFLAVHREHACPSFAQARTVGLEVEDDGVLAGAQLASFPNRAL